MPQTVFDVADLITSRLTLGVTPDGTTSAAVAVYRPDGQSLGALNTSAWVADQKTVQFFATDDGTATGTTVHAVGNWLVVWTVTGTGASVTPKIYPVRALPSPSDTRPGWAPRLEDVADHVPWLTVDTTTPGVQTYLGTFTGQTEPSDDQAQRHIDKATAAVGALLGTVPTTLYPLAARAAALEAAATLAVAFPRTRADVDTAGQLAAAATVALTTVRAAVDASDSAPSLTPQPVGYAPEPVWYGDLDL